MWMELILAMEPPSLPAPGPMAALACEAKPRVREATPQAIAEVVRGTGKKVLTFIGYSGAGYESPERMKREASRILDGHDPARTIVNIGATAEGIGAVYAIAKQKGFATMGIVSSLARDQQVAFSPCVDQVFVVKDGSWGGKLPGSEALSPTSSAMVDISTEVVAIGGGDVGRDELLAALAAGKPVRFVAAEMNHAIARRKARQQGKPEPTDFRGSLQRALPQGFPGRPVDP